MDVLRYLCCRSRRQEVYIGYGGALPYDDSKPRPAVLASEPVWEVGESSVEVDVTTHEGQRITTRARFTYGLERPAVLAFEPVEHILGYGGALPYDNSKPKPAALASEPVWEVGESSVEVDVTTHEGQRITTRARFTYGLERYEKNAMLIFAQTDGQPELIEKRVELLKRRFQQFGFEVEVHLDLGPEEMEDRLGKFFSKDFSTVGAVCVAVVGGTGEAGQLQAGALKCHESRVLDRLTTGLPPALAGRPRIYITEMTRTGVAADSGVYSLPITSQYPDVIAVHVPVIVEGDTNPLQMLCEKLGTERDFKAEVMSAAHQAETNFAALARRPIQVDSTLTVELELVEKDV